MKIIHIDIMNKKAFGWTRDGAIVCGNSDYKVAFTFDSEWDGINEKTARFKWGGQYYDVPFTGTECDVPIIMDAATVEIGVYAGELRTTTGADIPCLRSVLSGGATARPEFGGNYTTEAEAAAKAAKASEESAEAAAAEARESANAAADEATRAMMSRRAVTSLLNPVEKFKLADYQTLQNKLLNSAGVVTATTSMEAYITDYFVVVPGDTYEIEGNANWSNAIYAFYDEGRNILAVGACANPVSDRTFYEGKVTAPEGAKYIVVSGYYLIKPVIKQKVYFKPTFSVLPNKVLNTAGAVTATTSMEAYITDYVEMLAGDTYEIAGNANWGNAIYAFYDEGRNVLAVGACSNPVSDRTFYEGKVTAPEGAKYIVVSGSASIKPTIETTEPAYEISKKWAGKKWVCIGDSLTEKNIRSSKNYHDYVAEETGIKVINYGISGTGYKRRFENNEAFYQRALQVPKGVDVITIFGSGNDLYLYGGALGEVTDTGTETLCGCINTAIDNIHSILPTVPLGIVTPTPWSEYPPTSPGNAMELYAEKIKEICKRRGITCLDLYHSSGLRPWDETFRDLAYSKDEGGGTHPDETGHALIAPKFKQLLENLII